MQINDIINDEWTDVSRLKEAYQSAPPFPHIVMRNFIKSDLLEKVVDEFPDLAELKDNTLKFNLEREVKLATKGMAPLSESAFRLISMLNSDIFLNYIQQLTSIEEPLISDPYLAGGGYHEIKKGGLLKVHADFNRHPTLKLDRRLNLIIYLNKDWDEKWGGGLQLFNEDMSGPVTKVNPEFNTAVCFTTTSFTFHGHPDPLECPENRSRKSLALYYFSTGRPKHETNSRHSTIFVERQGEKFTTSEATWKDTVKDFIPPIFAKAIKNIKNKKHI